MDKPTEVLGYLACGTCLTPKAIKHCKGRRSAYLMGNCECGPDQRTGKAAQAKMSGFKPLEEVQADLDALKAPAPVVVTKPIEAQSEPKNEPETKPLETKPQAEDKPNDETQLPETNPISTAACVGMGALFGLVCGGLIKTLKAVA